MRSIRKSIAESDDDATRSSLGGGSSAATAQRHIDLSLLRKPILTAITGFVEAFKAYEAGTEEIRKLLSSECDVLYECRVCRNIFRSLTNFISHKRVYCRKLFNAAQHFHFQNDGFLDQDIATILQAEQDSQNKAKKAHADILNKDLSSIIERLRRKQHKAGAELSMTDYYDKVNHKLTQDDLSRRQHLLQLDRVPATEAAVFQTVRIGVVDCMRTQVGELENLNNNNNDTVLGPDGKVLEPRSRPQSTLPVIRGPSEQYFKPIELEREGKAEDGGGGGEASEGHSCLECNLRFDTEKTLKLHTDMKHTPSTYVYTCPSCPKTFMQPGAVIRHLCNDHKKSMRRIKMMRDSILKRRVRADEVVVKGPSREVSRLLQAASSMSATNSSSQDGATGSSSYGMPDDHDEAAATRAWMENLEHFDQGPMCSYCGKTFERKAVLSTHMQTCVHKLRQTENGSVPPPPASSSSSSSGSSSRRSRTKDESSLPAVVTKIKLEPVEPTASDDSNSYDVPLSTLQARISQETKVVESVVTIKPEELALHEDVETSNRRKRKKPMIMLRNATDDISWETEEIVAEETSAVEVSVKPSVPIKRDVLEGSEVAKKAPRNRKKKTDESEVNEAHEKALIKRLEQGEEIECRCLKKYNDPEKYKRHLKVYHSRQRRFWCAICEFKGYRKVDTINHLMQEHKYEGDVEDLSSLINFQPVEKPKKAVAPSPANNEPINSIIEAVSRICDTSTTDISFMEVSTEQITMDSTTSSSVNVTLNTTTTTEVPTPEPSSPKKRPKRPTRALRESICITAEEDSSKKPTKPPVVPLEDSGSPTSRRPIRNRVKPVNKDFVYDLTHLLYKEEDFDKFPLVDLMQDKATHPSKPLQQPDSSRVPPVATISPSKRESLRSHVPKPIPSHLYRGAALKMATRQVELGRAAFHRPPELPQERSFIPSQMSPPRRITSIHDWPVVKKDRKIGSITKVPESDIQIKRRYAKRVSSIVDTLQPELNRERRKIIPRRNSVIPMRPRQSVSIEILNKLSASRTAAGLEVVQHTDIPPVVKCPNEAELRRVIEANLKDHRATMSLANPNGTTVEDLNGSSSTTASEEEVISPRKRITLMQRLQENRTKRMQEQNGITPTKEKPSTPTSSPSSPQPGTSSNAAMPGRAPSIRSLNVADMLHAKLKRFSSHSSH
nr:uncharacterized protein LOC109421992 [Aedes albopictus]XP_029711168.1 uncharacterized protein LOC109421992 [Aedes albopictus]XP_029711169.1 uncharacterized protein LOC109421992 [Aedes albopictus]XP_029711170.1 uncharacterized protein LOC109421992 [Aedes albopictus]